LPFDAAQDGAGDDGGPDNAAGNVVQIAPIIAAKVRARSLYWRGWAISQIAEELGLPYATVSSWKTRQKWDEASPPSAPRKAFWSATLRWLPKRQRRAGILRKSTCWAASWNAWRASEV
jgi:transposase